MLGGKIGVVFYERSGLTLKNPLWLQMQDCYHQITLPHSEKMGIASFLGPEVKTSQQQIEIPFEPGNNQM